MKDKIAPRAIALAAAAASLIVAGIGMFVWSTAAPGSESAGAENEVTGIVVYTYRGALPEGVHPSVWVDDYPIVALITVEKLGDSRFSSTSGKFEGMTGDLIYTPVTVAVDEYIKGSGAKTMAVWLMGGNADGITLDMETPLVEGDEAVVFLGDGGHTYDGFIVHNAYLIKGDVATSELDEKTLSVSDLLNGLRDAAASDPHSSSLDARLPLTP